MRAMGELMAESAASPANVRNVAAQRIPAKPRACIAGRQFLGPTSLNANNALERACDHRGRPVLAMAGVRAGAEWAPCPAAQPGR
jgi:HAD superfamily hydrolase (TIGR01509 family)